MLQEERKEGKANLRVNEELLEVCANLSQKKGKQVKRMKVVKMSKMLDMKCMQIYVCLKSVEINAECLVKIFQIPFKAL